MRGVDQALDDARQRRIDLYQELCCTDIMLHRHNVVETGEGGSRLPLLVVPVGDLLHDVIERRRVKAGPLDDVDGESPRSLPGSDQRIIACA